jgi:LysR family transcriptional regulator, carnitine catabolism transcriptional activator
MKFSLQQLSAFLHLARTGSFGEAARLHGVSQPALSRTIQQMEEVVGRRLFDRSTRSVELTATGRELRPIAERLVAEFGGAFGELARFVEGRRGRVVVAALPSVAAALLPHAIARFRTTHPDVDILIRDSLSEGVVEAVAQGGADLGVTVRSSPAKGLSYRQLAADRFGLVCRPDDPLAGREAVPWSVFEARPFVAMAPASSVRAMTDAAFLQAGVLVAPLYECAFLGTTGSLVAAGLGITALPRLTLPLVGAAGLVWRPLFGPSLDRSIGVLTRVGRALPPAAEQFLAVLFDEARSHADERQASAAPQSR